MKSGLGRKVCADFFKGRPDNLKKKPLDVVVVVVVGEASLNS